MTVASQILLVEDDGSLRNAIAAILEREQFGVDAVRDGLAARQALAGSRYEVVLLDIGLPFVDGWRILANLEGRNIPSVIIISARGEESDTVRALDMGADDYLAKPFGAEELVARIRAVLRRRRPAASPQPAIRLEDTVIDLGAHTVRRGGADVHLSPTEYGLLVQLAQRAGTVVDHRTLLQEVWGPSYVHERNYLRTFIQRLRHKLEENPREPRLIVTVGSRGYRLGPPAEVTVTTR